jgi:hypothetical protein
MSNQEVADMRSQCRATLFVTILVAAPAIIVAVQPDADRFVGTWRLVSIVEGGKPVPARGARPTGIMFMDAKGNLSVQTMPDTARPSWPDGASPTAEQALAALRGYSAFFGTYTVDEKARTITYHRKGDIQPGNVGTDLVRRYEFLPNGHLVVRPEDYPDRRITWELVR